MIIKDEKIIEEGVKIFNSIKAFKFACSDYFRFKNKGFDDDAIQDFLDLSKLQIAFLSELWDNPKYSEPYKKEPWVIIGANLSDQIHEQFESFDNFKVKFIDFMCLKFQNTPLTEIRGKLNLSYDQRSMLLSIFNVLSKKLDERLEYLFFKEV